MSSSITINVPISESLDKYTILKLKNKQNPLNSDIKNELSFLETKLQQYISDPKLKYYIKILEYANFRIYVKCDELRNLDCSGGGGNGGLIGLSTTDTKQQCQYGIVAYDIVKWNDARFRAKKKIDSIINSDLKEVKNYKLRKCLFLGHLGMGDHFTLNAAIRYLSFFYDEVCIVVNDCFLQNLQYMYQDDANTIKFHPVTNEEKKLIYKEGFGGEAHKPTLAKLYDEYKKKDYVLIKNGVFCGDLKDFWSECFYLKMYKQLSLDNFHETREIWSYVPESAYDYILKIHSDTAPETILKILESGNDSNNIEYNYYNIEFLKQLKFAKDNPHKYIFVHEDGNRAEKDSSDNYTFNIKINTNNSLVLRPIDDISILHYKPILENALEIHVLDSVFFCMASFFLDLSKVSKCVCYVRKTTEIVSKNKSLLDNYINQKPELKSRWVFVNTF